MSEKASLAGELRPGAAGSAPWRPGARAGAPPDMRWIAALALWVGVTHAGFLATEVVDWDESTFVLMAADVLDGRLPYVPLFDTKPPMMFFMLAGALAAFGESIPLVRLFGAACILASSIAAFAVARRWVDPVSAGLAAFMLVAVTAVFNRGAVFTELPATAFLMAASWLLIARGDRPWTAAAAGMLLSLAVLTRTNLAVVAAAAGLWLVCGRMPFGARVRAAAAFALAGALPIVAIVLLYWSAGALAELRLALIDVPAAFWDYAVDPARKLRNFARPWLRRIESEQPLEALTFGSFTLGIAAGLAAAARTLLRGECGERRKTALLLLLCAAVFASILVSDKRSHAHYLLQLFPICMVFCALGLARARRAAMGRGAALAAVLLCCGWVFWKAAPSAVRFAADPGGAVDAYPVRRAARAILKVREPDERVWALDSHLVYWYLDARPPWPLAHPSNAVKPHVVEPLAAAGLVPPGSLLRAAMAARPAWLVTRQSWTSYTRQGSKRSGEVPVPWYMPDEAGARLRRMIADEYALFHVEGRTRVYRKLGHPGGAAEGAAGGAP